MGAYRGLKMRGMGDLDDDALDIATLMGPGHVDQEVRSALRNCWLFVDKNERTVDRVVSEFRRIVERAIKDLREDSQAFGVRKGSP